MVDCGPGAAPVMVDLAEKLVPLIDDGAWALFAKNGADVTTLAVTLARAHTGKRTVLVANGAYHGSLPWCNPDVQGTVPGDRADLDYFDFNDLDSVRAGDRAPPRRPRRADRLPLPPAAPGSTRKRRRASSRSACASSATSTAAS